MALGDVVKAYRDQHGLSLRDLAQRCGLSHTFIDTLEKGVEPKTGKPSTPTVASLQALAKGMNMSFDELMQAAGYIDSPGNDGLPGAILPELTGLISQLSPDEQRTLADSLAAGPDAIAFLAECRRIPNFDIDDLRAMLRILAKSQPTLPSSKDK